MSRDREAAAYRAEVVEVNSYEIYLDLTERVCNSARLFASQSVIGFTLDRFLPDLWVDVDAVEITSVTLDGEPFENRETPAGSDGLCLGGLAVGQHTVCVNGLFAYAPLAGGLFRSTSGAEGPQIVYTHLQPYWAHTVFACFDQPDMKAPFSITVDAPTGWTLISNARVAERTAMSKTEVERWTFCETAPLPPYLVALAGGDFTSESRRYGAEGREVPVTLYMPDSFRSSVNAEAILSVTRRGLHAYERALSTPFPFSKYDLCLVPGFPAAGMENPGCVMLSAQFFAAGDAKTSLAKEQVNVLLHELAHMWFGNSVTARWWDDLWLHESLATWGTMHVTGQLSDIPDPFMGFALSDRHLASELDRTPATRPLSADLLDGDAVKYRFDQMSYAKGAAIMRQLESVVGGAPFRKGLALYLSEHANGCASTNDFIRAMQACTGRDLGDWFDRWVMSPGINTLRPSSFFDSDGDIRELVVIQSPSPGSDTLRQHVTTVTSLRVSGRHLTPLRQLRVIVDGETSPVPDLVGHPGGDVLLIDAASDTYALTVLERDPGRALVAGLQPPTDLGIRTALWSASWNMLREGTMGADRFVRLALAALPRERDATTVGWVVHRAHDAIFLYSPREAASQLWIDFSDALVEGVLRSESGFDSRLHYLQGLAASVHPHPVLDKIAEWLVEPKTAPDITRDATTRELLHLSLAAHGAVPDGLSGTMLRDLTTTRSDFFRVACMAASPDRASKDRAWRLICDTREDFWLRRAALGAFVHPAQVAQLCRYENSFFDRLEEFIDEDPLAHALATIAYPVWTDNTDTLKRADASLKGSVRSPLHPSLVERNYVMHEAFALRHRGHVGSRSEHRATEHPHPREIEQGQRVLRRKG